MIGLIKSRVFRCVWERVGMWAWLCSSAMKSAAESGVEREKRKGTHVSRVACGPVCFSPYGTERETYHRTRQTPRKGFDRWTVSEGVPCCNPTVVPGKPRCKPERETKARDEEAEMPTRARDESAW